MQLCNLVPKFVYRGARITTHLFTHLPVTVLWAMNRAPVQMGQLTVFGEGDTIVVRAANVQESRSPEMELFILGGEPIKEPVAWMGPFVMNTKREVLQAFEDFQKGVLGSIPVIEKGHRPNAQLNRSGEGSKLGGSNTPNSTADAETNSSNVAEILDVHGAPTTMQEG